MAQILIARHRSAMLATIAVSALLFGNPCTAANFHVLYSFAGGADGVAPQGLIPASHGGYYGVTVGGGSDACTGTTGCGTVFEIARDGSTKSILFAPDGSNGQNVASVTSDQHGNLFGVAWGGPYSQGVVFKLHRKADGSWSEKTLYAFTGKADGYVGCFACTLLVDKNSGILYGPASGGNPGGHCGDGQFNGCGLIYALIPKDHTWKYRIIYNFNDTGGANGRDPLGPLTEDESGALYGATYAEGPSKDCDCGVVFKLTPPSRSGLWTFNLIHAFTKAPDGANASSGVIRDAQGDLWGATSSGGNASCDCGAIYKISGKKESTVYAFKVDGGGYWPDTAPIFDSSGAIYGATEDGGYLSGPCYALGGCGVIYKLTNSGGTWSEAVLHTFHCSDGSGPNSLVMRQNGVLYGTSTAQSTAQGSCGYGNYFDLK
jgi:uncharacterized repeat protein (TIGR03803 family)